jgi:hypothetical protein
MDGGADCDARIRALDTARPRCGLDAGTPGGRLGARVTVVFLPLRRLTRKQTLASSWPFGASWAILAGPLFEACNKANGTRCQELLPCAGAL